jgi:carbon-monoxide dehydrogenase medium subunit
MVVFYRRMPKFDYLKPQSFSEVLSLLKEGGPDRYKVFAGGTDLMDQLKQRKIDIPKAVIDLKGISELNFIKFDENEGLRIGALTTVTDVATSPEIEQHYPALSQGAREIASIQIQNRATITGNICNAVSSADSAPPLLALGAEVACESAESARDIKIESFFAGPGKTVLQPGELVREIKLPPPAANSDSLYLKLAPRGRMDLDWVPSGRHPSGLSKRKTLCVAPRSSGKTSKSLPPLRPAKHPPGKTASGPVVNTVT